jgi:adenine C2-methylase RlmN of 23S rRNA A2503 and tRNA A37
MNANELADDMENGRFNDINYNKKKASDFVRQQQDEIDKLKNLLLDNQILLDKTLNAWAKEMERKK